MSGRYGTTPLGIQAGIPGHAGWGLVGSVKEMGSFTLNKDGSLVVQGTLRLVPEVLSRVSPLALGKNGVRWATGHGGELEILTPDATYAFKWLTEGNVQRAWIGQERPSDPGLQDVLAAAWQPMGAGEFGGIAFLQDGTIQVPDGRRLPRDGGMEDCTSGDGARLDKAKGEGQEFTARATNATHALVYLGGFWYYQRRRAE